MEDDGVKALSEAFKINTTLATLSLVSNSIRDNGAQALSEASRALKNEGGLQKTKMVC